jgi:hypothetical protein
MSTNASTTRASRFSIPHLQSIRVEDNTYDLLEGSISVADVPLINTIITLLGVSTSKVLRRSFKNRCWLAVFCRKVESCWSCETGGRIFVPTADTVEISAALNALAKEGCVPTIDELAALSPYQTRHIKRFGNYELDLQAVPAPETDTLTFEIEPPKEAVTIEADQNACPEPERGCLP